MRRRVGLTDFKELHESVFQWRAGRSWLKCDRYEIREGEIVAAPDRVRGFFDEVPTDYEGWDFYDPIEDVPDLFLRFARLYDEPDFNRAALDFATRYGLPNGTDEAPAPSGEVEFETIAINWTLSQFHHEARRAWVVLTLYEAVLNYEDRTVHKLLSEHRDIEIFEMGRYLLQGSSGERQGLTLGLGLRCAIEQVERVVHKYCRQRIWTYFVPDIKPNVSYEMDSVWMFDNLLGAMYLQMYWLMASSDSVARCDQCGRIIPLGRSHPKGRKRRSDKRFCDDACRQAHHRSKKRV